MSIPKEIERKFIISKPRISLIEEIKGFTSSEITQIYLESSGGITHRIRARMYPERTVYTETKKIRIDKLSSYEDEREITEEDFRRLSKNIASGTHPVKKRRISFPYESHTVEIDIYPEWQRSAVMELELRSCDEEISLPDFIHVIREVSGIKEYSNAAFSRIMPIED